MQYFIIFLEGMITFISPCLLPMLPVYLSYFAGQEAQPKRSRTILTAVGFVIGFTLVFAGLGAFAGAVGKLFAAYRTVVNLVTGLLVVLFGLGYLDIIRLPQRQSGSKMNLKKMGFLKALLFGAVFSVSWTPCVGAFLGSALMTASYGANPFAGVLLLLCYSLGLGIPFIVSAFLLDQLKAVFDLIKRNYGKIRAISGMLLIVTGILMMCGLWGKWIALLT